MFQRLVRRISTSFLPRPDRPWNGDATSNAPQIQIGKKRRYDEDEDDDNESMPPPSTPGTPVSPGTPGTEAAYGSVMKKQKVKLDMDIDVSAPPEGETGVKVEGEEAAAGGARAEAEAEKEETGESALTAVAVESSVAAAEEEAVKEVTEGVREVDISSPQQSQAITVPIAELPTSEDSATTEPSEPPVVVAESAAAVPLPASPVLEAKIPLESTEAEVAETEAKADETKEEVKQSNHEVVDLTLDEPDAA